MSTKIDAAQLSQTVKGALDEYGELSTKVLKETVDEVSKAAAQVVKAAAPVEKKSKRRGKYAKHIKVDTEYEDHHTKRNKVWASAHEYSLSHLLEYGHDIVGHKGAKKGAVIGRTGNFEHFDKGDDYVEHNFEKRIKRKLER